MLDCVVDDAALVPVRERVCLSLYVCAYPFGLPLSTIYLMALVLTEWTTPFLHLTTYDFVTKVFPMSGPACSGTVECLKA